MSITQQLGVAEASRLSVTAIAADLEDWTGSGVVHGQVDFHDVVNVLNVRRPASAPQHSGPSAFPTLAAS